MIDTSNLINPLTGKTYTNEELMEAINADETASKIYKGGERFGWDNIAESTSEKLKSAINDYWNSKYKDQLQSDLASQPQFDSPVTSAEPEYEANQKAADTQQAIAESAQTAQAEAEKNAAAAASAGINKSRAGMLSDNAAQQSQTSNVSNIATANSSQAASTQADYLQKMAQADALDQQARNMKSGAALTAIGGGIQGAATGASFGLISDENMKEEPFDDDKLYDAIREFKRLYMKVKELRRK